MADATSEMKAKVLQELPPWIQKQLDQQTDLDVFQQVNLADGVRLMMDNQRMLDSESRHAEKIRQFEEASMFGFGTCPESLPEQKKSDGGDDMQFSLNSPVAHTNHYYPTPTKPGLSPLMKVAAAGAVGLLAATGVGLPMTVGLTMLPSIIKAWKGDPPQPMAPPQSNNILSEYDLFVGPPPGKRE